MLDFVGKGRRFERVAGALPAPERSGDTRAGLDLSLTWRRDMQAALAPILQYVLEPLSERGFLEAFCCDLPLTRHMLYHPLVSRVRMTGSKNTHDAIVWGQDVRL